MNNAAASHVSMEFNLKGPVLYRINGLCQFQSCHGASVSNGAYGPVQTMITGGSESMLCFGGIKAWEGLRVMSKDACRPFSANRNGMVQGEGAAIFVFEELEHAKARGADILAEVTGFAMSSDASDIVMPSQQGAARAIQGRCAMRV
jgi:nodulation protein E